MLKQLLIPYYYKGVIYQIINIQNRKSYIGKTTNEDPIEYIEDHFENALNFRDNGNKYFYNAIRKYGKENFKWIILGRIFGETEEQLRLNLNEAEIDCIYHFRTFGGDGEKFDKIYGYNLTKGGDGGNTYLSFSEKRKKESYEKMASKNRGRKASNKRRENCKISAIKQWEDPKRREKNSNSLKKFHEKNPGFLAGKNNPRYIEVDINKLKELINLDLNRNEICEILNISKGILKRCCDENNLKIKRLKRSFICNICGKEFTSSAIGHHKWRAHTIEGRNFIPNNGKTIWNKGLNKEECTLYRKNLKNEKYK